MLACEDKDDLERQMQAWCDGLARFGLKLNFKKTEYLTTDVNESGSNKINGTELARTSVTSSQISSKTIKVGLMFVENVTNLDVYMGYRFIYNFDQCDEVKAAGVAIGMMLNDGVDVVIGPTCNYPTAAASIISSFYNKPLFTWGLSTSSEFDDTDRFPTMSVLSVNSYR
ncbi:unnamed protein product [Heligmosomoides polygyrus]|uniref:ANF_receptor domain-containing protein n=1 Tax=Heligmosomoides polygyrus TaxID=6339 RepID=A0A183G6S5_HELPZ|nr:unnamed protein product [Heligmosomoides polygyrus]